jgi:hypothetical protein
MLHRWLVVFVFVGALGLASNTSAQNKAEEQDKKLSEQFATAFAMKKDLDGTMKLTAVPFLWGFGGEGDQLKVVTKLDDLKKEFKTLLDNPKFKAATGTLKFDKSHTYEEMLAKSGDKMPAATRKKLDEVLKKADRFVYFQIKSEDKTTTHLTVMVGQRDDQARVVGYAIAWEKGASKEK